MHKETREKFEFLAGQVPKLGYTQGYTLPSCKDNQKVESVGKCNVVQGVPDLGLVGQGLDSSSGTPRRGGLRQVTYFCISFLVFCFFFLCPYLRPWSSWARGQIRASAAGLHHSCSNTRSKLICDLHHSLWQHWILFRIYDCNLRNVVYMGNIYIFLFVNLPVSQLVELKVSFFSFFCGGGVGGHPWHVEVPRPGTDPAPQQWQCWILNSLNHLGTPEIYSDFP